MNTNMSPLYVEILLYQYIWRTQPGHTPVLPKHMEMYPAQRDCLAHMIENGLLNYYGEGYVLTPRGVAFVENILNTPMPVEDVRWIDPRFRK